MTITRFAPSPTGSSGIHIGNLRTALYSYLYAKQNNGKFILRIEDTDKDRSNLEAVDDIHQVLNLLKLEPDEVYVQSDRLHLYTKYAHLLVENGYAYICNCCKDSDDVCSCSSNNLKPYENYCIKLSRSMFKLKHSNDDRFNNGVKCYDEIRKFAITVEYENLYDIVLLKSDGRPTYHLASVVDDHLMKVTDVFRGDEWLGSFPYHIMLYTALGFNMPKFYHLPLILNAFGDKLSKRDGDFSVRQLYSNNILPSAIINYVALLGWHPSGNSEKFTIKELINEFDIKRLTKSPARYDEKKLNSINLFHGRTGSGYLEFVYKYLKYDRLYADRLYSLFVIGIDINKLISTIHKYCNSVCDEILHEITDADTLILKDFITVANDVCPNMADKYSLLSENEISTILASMLTIGYTIKDINRVLRLCLTGSIQGLPVEKLISIVYTEDLFNIITKTIDRYESIGE